MLIFPIFLDYIIPFILGWNTFWLVETFNQTSIEATFLFHLNPNNGHNKNHNSGQVNHNTHMNHNVTILFRWITILFRWGVTALTSWDLAATRATPSNQSYFIGMNICLYQIHIVVLWWFQITWINLGNTCASLTLANFRGDTPYPSAETGNWTSQTDIREHYFNQDWGRQLASCFITVWYCHCCWCLI